MDPSKAKGKKGKAKGDRFEDVKTDMIERLTVIRELMTTASSTTTAPPPPNPKEVIT